MSFRVILIVSLAAIAIVSANKCLECPENGPKTCGSNGEDWRIFKNFCELQAQECLTGVAWYLFPMKFCEDHGVFPED